MRSVHPAALRRSVAAVAMMLAIIAPPGSSARADESDAKALLKAMSDYLASQERISFEYDATLEVVTEEDQKLGLASSGSVTMGRPNRIRATRHGGFVDLEMVFDGETLTLLGKSANLFTQVAVPGDVDHLIDELRNTYDRPLPAADLLMSNAYDALMSEVTDVKDLGSGVIDGQECDWLAFRTPDVDWQIWIAQGERPYPCRYVITTKGMEHSPQYVIQARNWRTGTDAKADDFTFVNETDASRIELDELREKVRELPDHFIMGEGQ
ncbi:DUF2092 domain-containing protein [Limibaculum sp. FT325]|uniref:DUF2092 domain-containing protein n=1 Tax=Thermohalobaculum sediminis TaxID=2939436 RepID=UPI0020C06709|nr:DUF2092 domain-containing protein [Limibaculum sediminis]MCL5779161.1 DUF2092 domain-containing protein [Limibaculum sediminis]